MSLTATEEALLRELIDQQAALLSLAGNESTITSKLGATKVTLSDLPSASSLNDTDLVVVRQGTEDKSATGSVLKVFSLPDSASTTTKGIVELATATETITGTDTTRAVTPAGIASLTASEARAGLVELATSAESQALSDDTKIITALKLSTAFQGSNVSKTANGWQKLPSGLILQWGFFTYTASGVQNQSITLPIAFQNAILAVSVNSGDRLSNTYIGANIALSTTSALTFGSVCVGEPGSVRVSWMAIGY